MAHFVHSDLIDCVDRDTVRMAYRSMTFDQRQTIEFNRICLPRLLRYEDRNSMSFSIEARVPLLGKELIELAMGLSAEWKVREGWTKYIVRKSMEGILPDEVIWNRRKRGFDVPEALWMTILIPSVLRWLDGCPDRPLNIPAIRDALRAKPAGCQWFWRLISFALWVNMRGVGI